MRVNVPADQAIVDRNQRSRGLEQVLARLQGTLAMKKVPNEKSLFAANDSGGFQFCRNLASRGSGLQKNELLPSWTGRGEQVPS